jgi:hypothetical protein
MIPIFVLIILDRDPPVIIAKTCVIRKDQRTGLILQMDHPVRIVGSRIDHMPQDLLDRPVLAVSSLSQYILWKLRQYRFPCIYAGALP